MEKERTCLYIEGSIQQHQRFEVTYVYNLCISFESSWQPVFYYVILFTCTRLLEAYNHYQYESAPCHVPKGGIYRYIFKMWHKLSNKVSDLQEPLCFHL